MTSVARKRSDLWRALADFITANNGWITSPPDRPVVRVEIPRGSALPAKLQELGYDPKHVGSDNRLVSGGASPFQSVDVIEIKLPR